MCVKFFFGYICGHCSTPWIVKCPTALASPTYPACSIPAEKGWDTYRYCHPCSRVDWNNKVLADEKLHREAHLAGNICCDVIFKEEDREQRLEHINNKAKGKGKGKGKNREYTKGNGNPGVGPSNANPFESDNGFANMGGWNGAGPFASDMQFEHPIGPVNTNTLPNNHLGASSPNMPASHFDNTSRYAQSPFPPFTSRVPRPEYPAYGLTYTSVQNDQGIVGGNQHGHGITGGDRHAHISGIQSGDPRDYWTQEAKAQAYSYVGYMADSEEKPPSNHTQETAEPPVVPFQLSSNGVRYYTDEENVRDSPDEEIIQTNPELPPFPEPLFRFGFSNRVPYTTPTFVQAYCHSPSRPEVGVVDSTEASEKDSDGDDDVEIITEKKVAEASQPVVTSNKGKGKETSEN